MVPSGASLRAAIDEASRSGFLADLPPDVSTALLSDHTIHHLPADQIFVEEDDEVWVGVVVAGLVQLSLRTADGRWVGVHRVVRGRAIGLATMIDPQIRTVARTVGPCSVLELDARRLRRALLTHATVGHAVAREIAASLRDSYAELAVPIQRSTRHRVAKYLLDRATVLSTRDRQVDRTHEAIADAIGSSREVVTRVLASFREEGLVHLQRGRVTLLRPEDLARTADDLDPWPRPLSRS